jgi:hypothetical protein
MGFRVDPAIYNLNFSDQKYGNQSLSGLEVQIESLSVDEFLEMQRLSVAARKAKPEEADTSSAEKLLDGFAKNLNSWNLEDKHGPVPATRDGVGSQKFDLILQIILAWMEAIAGVDPTSRPALNGGGTYPEEALPMEVLSSPSPTS